MQTNESNNQVRAYFLQQGASIAKFNTILNSNLLVHRLQKWLSVFLELSLFLMSLVLLIVAIVMPSNPNYLIPVNESDRLQVSLHNNSFADFILLPKLLNVGAIISCTLFHLTHLRCSTTLCYKVMEL